jgi:hypothetical protein
MELRPQLVLPLLDEAARGDDQAALHVPTDGQLLDEEPRHDRLAGPGVIGQKEPQRLAREHLSVDARDLVGERLDVGGMNSEERVEEVGETDSQSLRDQAEELSVAVERPSGAGGFDLQPGLVVPVEELVTDVPLVVTVGERNRRAAVPGCLNDGNGTIGEYASKTRSRREVLKPRHRGPLYTRRSRRSKATVWASFRRPPTNAGLRSHCLRLLAS